MTWKYLDAVYNLNQSFTTASEQAVLLALTFRENPKTLLCCPGQTNLTLMTHIKKRAIQKALNGLKAKGYITWETGGFKSKRRKKGGQLLANEYRINFKKIFEQAEQEKANRQNAKQSVAAKDVNSNINRVMNSDASNTLQCAPDAHDSVHEPHTAVRTRCTPTEIIKGNKKPKDNRKGSGSGLSIGNAVYGVLRDMDIAPPPSNEDREAQQQKNIVEDHTAMALRICGIEKGSPEYKANYNTFKDKLSKIDAVDPGCAQDILYQFESEKRQGELKDIRNLAALLTDRLNGALQPSQ